MVEEIYLQEQNIKVYRRRKITKRVILFPLKISKTTSIIWKQLTINTSYPKQEKNCPKR